MDKPKTNPTKKTSIHKFTMIRSTDRVEIPQFYFMTFMNL